MSTLSENLQTIKDATDIIRGKLDMPTDSIRDVANAVTIPSIDWSLIGYSSEPEFLTEGFNRALDIYDNYWDPDDNTGSALSEDPYLIFCPLVDTSKRTNFANFVANCPNLISIPDLDTSNLTICFQMCMGCNCLQYVPVINMAKVTNSLFSMFSGCVSLNDTSLDNILQSLMSAVNYTGTKTLSATTGLSRNNYPASRIKALPHYQDFLDAGWTIGWE